MGTATEYTLAERPPCRPRHPVPDPLDPSGIAVTRSRPWLLEAYRARSAVARAPANVAVLRGGHPKAHGDPAVRRLAGEVEATQGHADALVRVPRSVLRRERQDDKELLSADAED